MAATQEDLNLLSSLRNEIAMIKSEIAAMKVHGDQQASLAGQYEGKPIPSRIGNEVVFDGSDRKIQINIPINSDGDYFASTIAFAFRFDFCSGEVPIGMNWSAISSIEDVYLLTPTIDFYWEYYVSGSGRQRQNIPVPSAMIQRTETGMGWFPLIPQDTFPAASVVTIWITPTLNLNSIIQEYEGASGIIWAGFNGFYSLFTR
jgi:hypothetical protein